MISFRKDEFVLSAVFMFPFAEKKSFYLEKIQTISLRLNPLFPLIELAEKSICKGNFY